ncbi:transcription antitermination factor NusB [Streptomyces rhizosphaericola]|uniref:transcription antitermination factor NusB n=1 Tax=Streptomyces rhizosphaericola TaxID=2564098 RepID=UPI0026C613A1
MNDQPRRRPAKPHRRPKKDPVRFLAFEALRAVDERDAYANLVLPPLLKKARAKGDFDGRDAALATELVYGTLRRQGTYDAIVAACIDRPLREVDPPVLDVLNMGVHQLLGTRIPTHAAVSASVELARVVLGEGRAKFVNAVLRKVSAHDLDGWVEKVAPPYEEDAEDHLAVVHSHPRWVVSALWDALGGGRAGIEDLLEADNERPEVTLVARPGRSTTEELVKALGDENALPGRWSPYAVRMAEGGEVEVGAVRGGGGGVAVEEGVEGGVGAAREGQGEPGGLVRGGEGGAQQAEHRARGRVRDRSPDGRSARAQGVAPVGAEGQLQGGRDRMGAVRGGVGGGGGAEDPGLAVAVGGDPDVAPGLDPFPYGDGQRLHVERPGAARTQEGEAEGGERGDVVGADGAGAAVGAVQEVRAGGGGGLVGGDDRAAVVRDEARPPRPAGLITDSHQRRPVPTAHGPTVGRR